MRRSQMIQALEYLISTCHPEEFPSAEDILKCVEENGMNPPKVGAYEYYYDWEKE